MPPELADARLAYAERTFVAPGQRLIAKVDRAYDKNGRIWLAELKTRKQHRVFPADVVELSAQRVAVEAETGAPVGAIGFVLTEVRDRSRQVHRVELMDQEQIESLIRRRAAILGGRLAARYANSPASCATCAYRRECSAIKGRLERRPADAG